MGGGTDKRVYEAVRELDVAIRAFRDSELTQLRALLMTVAALDAAYPQMTAPEAFQLRPNLQIEVSTFKVYISQARGLLRAYGSIDAVLAIAKEEQSRRGQMSLKKLYDARPR